MKTFVLLLMLFGGTGGIVWWAETHLDKHSPLVRCLDCDVPAIQHHHVENWPRPDGAPGTKIECYTYECPHCHQTL